MDLIGEEESSALKFEKWGLNVSQIRGEGRPLSFSLEIEAETPKYI